MEEQPQQPGVEMPTEDLDVDPQTLDPEPQPVKHEPSSRHRSYSSGILPADLEPVTFSLNGEVFKCRAWVTGALISEFGMYMTSDRVELQSRALLSLYNHVMDEAEAARFHRYIYDPDHLVDVQVLGEIFAGLMEEYAQRPLQRRGTSGTGLRSTGAISTGDSSSQART